jgi:hypothetical protein
MTKDEALNLALEALELNNLEWKALADSGDCGYWNAEDQDHYKQTNEAITAIKQARSAPVQEPVAWTVSGKITDWSKDFSAYQTKHYTRPVYTPPAVQRQWVGLTDEEIATISKETHFESKPVTAFARAIEAKLNEKNT